MIRVTDIQKHFGALHVLRGISFEVQKGEAIVIIGPSGSGKSTLLRCINLLVEPDSGQVFIDGVQVNRHGIRHEWVRQQVGMVFQSFNLFTHLTAIDNVTLGLTRVKGMPPDKAIEKARELLARVGLAAKENSYPAELSGGQQQRVAIARALAMDPKAMLFDEPTSALDPELIGEVLKVIGELAIKGRTSIIVTHELAFARDIASKIVFMDAGLIVEEGPPDKLLTSPKLDRTRAFIARIL